MSIGAYYTLFRPSDFGTPYVQSIVSIAPQVDTVVVLVDPSVDDGAYAVCNGLAREHKSIRVIEMECPMNSRYPLAEWKNEARALLKTDWALECDPFWVFPNHFATLTDSVLPSLADNIVAVALGSLNLFNGDNIKHVHPKLLPVLSRRVPGIAHGGEERRGCGLITAAGRSVQHSLSLANPDFKRGLPKDFRNTSSLWVWCYEWYDVCVQYELKMFNHYIEGAASGKYGGVDSYTEDLDGNPVSIYDVTFRLPLSTYRTPLVDEMLNASIRPVRVAHPESMKAWLAQARTLRSAQWSPKSLSRRLAKRIERIKSTKKERILPPPAR